MSWTRTAAGWTAVILLATPLVYYQLTRGIPSRQRPGQAPRSKFGVVLVDGARQQLGTQLRRDGVDIIFVHGLGSNPDSTWRARRPRNATELRQSEDVDDDGVCWVTDLLIDDIPPAVRPKTRIFFYNHDSYWQREAVQTRLWNLAGNMLHHLQSRIRQTREDKERDLIFVAYSYGGLLVKQALIRAKNASPYQDIVNRTRAIVFLGTPHRGSSFTQPGLWFAWFLRPLGSNQSLLDEITYDSLHLQDLHEQFTQATGPDVQVYNFFEEHPTRLIDVGFFQWSQFCVNERSAKYSDASQRVQNIGLAVDHSGLNKFGTRTAEYELIRDTLVNLLPPPLQQIYSVPRGRVQTYTAREDLSQQIREALQVCLDDKGVAVDRIVEGFQAVVVHGMGGVGKTQLALNYAEETRGCYNPVFWIDAQTQETVKMSFERVAAVLGLLFDNPPTADIQLQTLPVVTGVCRWFSERDEGDPRWLVIVDNADDISWRIDEIIPRGSRGHVIVTSQHEQTSSFLGGSCQFVKTEEMAKEEALILLKKHICLNSGAESDQVYGAMDDLCNKVVGLLGYLALAVELAGLYLGDQLQHHLNDTNVTRSEAMYQVLRQYLDDFERHQDDLLQGEPFQSLSSYEMTVWTVWDKSLAAIERQFPQSHANQMLTFLAQFGPGLIEREMFRLASDGWRSMISEVELPEDEMPDWLQRMIIHSDTGWDDFYYRQATQPLMRYGLLRHFAGEWKATTMHNLVQWRARRAGEDSNLPWERWTLLFLLAAVRQTNLEEARPAFRRYVIAHVLEMNVDYIDLAQKLQLDEISIAWLGAELGQAFSIEGRLQKAKELEVQVMEIRKRVLGAEHPDTLVSMNNLATTLTQLGQYEEAKSLYQETLRLREKVRGKEHPGALGSMNNLAMVLYQLEQYEEAKSLCQETLRLAEKVRGKEHPDALGSMNSLAMVLFHLEQYEEAKGLHQETSRLSEKVLGKEHPDTLISMNSLAARISGTTMRQRVYVGNCYQGLRSC